EEIKRGRFINRTFHPNPAHPEDKLILKIVHIANTHFSKENFFEKRYQKAVKQINALNPDIVIHSGDITNDNKYPEFKTAFIKLKEIIPPKIIIPGDNDLRTIGWELFPKMIGPLEPYYENDKFTVIGINSVDKAIGNGNIGRKKVQETINFLNEKTKKKINIICFYHNVIPHPNTKFETMLSDSGNVLKFFTEPKYNIHFILTGHDHVSSSLQIEDTILCSSGTVSSKNYLDLDENTFNIINCYENGFVRVERIEVATNSSKILGQYWLNLF
ncbi:MAG: metallophosphoesterase family protein, partial [Promethearchaeota archaeon]